MYYDANLKTSTLFNRITNFVLQRWLSKFIWLFIMHTLQHFALIPQKRSNARAKVIGAYNVCVIKS